MTVPQGNCSIPRPAKMALGIRAQGRRRRNPLPSVIRTMLKVMKKATMPMAAAADFAAACVVPMPNDAKNRKAALR